MKKVISALIIFILFIPLTLAYTQITHRAAIQAREGTLTRLTNITELSDGRTTLNAQIKTTSEEECKGTIYFRITNSENNDHEVSITGRTTEIKTCEFDGEKVTVHARTDLVYKIETPGHKTPTIGVNGYIRYIIVGRQPLITTRKESYVDFIFTPEDIRIVHPDFDINGVIPKVYNIE